MRDDNWGAGPDGADPVKLAVAANPLSETVFGQAVEVQAQTNDAFGKHLDRVAEVGRKYTPEGRAAITPELLAAFKDEPIWRQAQAVEAQVEERVAELAQEVDNERRALTPELDMAGELRQQRAVDRARGDLAKVEGGWKGQAAAKILRNASAQDVGILVQELPHLLPDDVPAEVLEPAIRERAPEYASAQRKLATAQRGQAIVVSNGQKLRRAIGQEHRQSQGILGLQLDSGVYDPDLTK